MRVKDKPNTKVTLKLLIISFVVGAIVGTTGDFVHVITNTDGYPKGGPFPYLPLPVLMPVWVPFLYGTALMAMAIFYRISAGTIRPIMRHNHEVCFAAPIIFITLYALTGFVSLGTGGLQDAWIALVTLAIWYGLDRTFYGALAAVILAIIGTGFEIMLVHAGGFFYFPEHSNLIGVPSWLPWLYIAAGVCVSLFIRWIK